MGFNLGTFLQILKVVGPLVLASVGVPIALVPVILGAIGEAEYFATPHPHMGAEKKIHVLNAVGLATTAVNAVRPGTVVEGYQTTVSLGIDATIAVINLIQRQKEANAAVPPVTNTGVAPS